MQLGEFAAQARLALSAQPGGEIGERCGNARAGFEQNQRRRDAGELGDAGAPRGFLRRQKSDEQELIGRQARDGQCRHHRRGAGQCRDLVTGVLRGADELIAGVGDQRRAGVGHQRDRRAFGQPAQQHRPRLRRIVLVIGRQRPGDAVAVEQLVRDAGILAGDQVGAGQRLQGAQRDVAEIADRGGDDVQPGCEPCDLDGLAAKQEAAWRRFGSRPADCAVCRSLLSL